MQSKACKRPKYVKIEYCMFELLLVTAFLLLLACAAWVVVTAIVAVARLHQLSKYSVRDLFVFSTVVAVTVAMATALFGDK
jgi:hypothetical protein